VFVSASLIMMTVDHRQNYLESVRTALSAAIYPLYYVVNLPMSAGGWLQDNFTTRKSLMAENTRLHAQDLLLKAQVQKMAALEMENVRLRELLGASPKVSEHVMAAELLAVDIDPYARKVVLDKGSRDGVYEGQPLIDARGVMGQVIKVGPLSSTAMLITDTTHALPVMVTRTGLRTIAAGTGAAGLLDLQNLPSNTDIRRGDLLVTSGLDGRFPPNYPVATVALVKQEQGQYFIQVKATPTARLEHNRELLLVWPQAGGQTPGRAVVLEPTGVEQGAQPKQPQIIPAPTTAPTNPGTPEGVITKPAPAVSPPAAVTPAPVAPPSKPAAPASPQPPSDIIE
jgi:rod shape-determining protein MreC